MAQLRDPVAIPAPTGDTGSSWRSAVPPFAVLACSAVFFWSLSVRYLVFAQMPAIAEDLGLSTSASGLVVALSLLGHSLGSWSAGWLPGSRKARIAAGGATSILCSVSLSQAFDLYSLMLAGLLLGLGAGVYLPLGLAIIADEGGADRKARYTAVQEVAACLATFSGPTFVALTAQSISWRSTILLWCVVGVASLAVFSRVRSGKDERHGRSAGARIKVDRTLIYCSTIFVASSLLIGGLISVLPLILVRGWGIDQTEAASVVGTTRLAGLLGVLLVGLRGDMWGHRRVMLALQLVGLAGCAAMAATGFGPLFLGGVVAVAIAAGGLVTVQPAVVANAYSITQREHALGLAIAAGSLVGSVLAPAASGFMVDMGAPNGPMALGLAMILAAIFAANRIPARRS